MDPQTYSLPAKLSAQFQDAAIEDWKMGGKVRRLWARDASLWTGTDEGNWLGWLGITEDQLANKQHLADVAAEVKAAGFKHALLLGMGGSSLCPEVLRDDVRQDRRLPGTVRARLHRSRAGQGVRKQNRLSRKTIFIVSSKSGSTLEPNIFKQYFFERVKQMVGADKAGSRFIAITDPGSKMEQVPKPTVPPHLPRRAQHRRTLFRALGFRHGAGGRDGHRCARVSRPRRRDGDRLFVLPAGGKNPGVLLGSILGVAAQNGRDKVTLVTSPGIADLGAWLEQLLAESTGKDGKGIIPVDREPLGSPEVIRQRSRVRLYSPGEGRRCRRRIRPWTRSARPGIRWSASRFRTSTISARKCSAGRSRPRWRARSSASTPSISPMSKPARSPPRKLTSEYEKTGSLPPESPILSEGGIELLHGRKECRRAWHPRRGGDKTLAGYLRAHLNRLKAGDYFALLGYVEMNAAARESLQEMRTAVRDKKRVATCLGFGPRFLHSTGQAYKGGPNSGVFLQVTCDDKADLPVPGQKYTFGVVKAAQARGDFQVLAERNRRALRVHLDDWRAGCSAAIRLAKALS